MPPHRRAVTGGDGDPWEDAESTMPDRCSQVRRLSLLPVTHMKPELNAHCTTDTGHNSFSIRGLHSVANGRSMHSARSATKGTTEYSSIPG